MNGIFFVRAANLLLSFSSVFGICLSISQSDSITVANEQESTTNELPSSLITTNFETESLPTLNPDQSSTQNSSSSPSLFNLSLITF